MVARRQEVQRKKVTEGIGDRIREARKARDITQQGLAEISGHSKSQLAQWEIGARTPGIDGAFDLASAMGVSFDWLATGQGEMQADKGKNALPSYSSALFKSSMAFARQYIEEKGLSAAVDFIEFADHLYQTGAREGFDSPEKTLEECTEFFRRTRININLDAIPAER